MCVIIASKSTCAQGSSRSSPLEPRIRWLTPWQKRFRRILSVSIAKPCVDSNPRYHSEGVLDICYPTALTLQPSWNQGLCFQSKPTVRRVAVSFLVSLCDSKFNVSDLPAQRLEEHSIVKFSDPTASNHLPTTVFVPYVLVCHTLGFSDVKRSPVSWALCTP